ncbi:MAG: hypothetical protein ACJA0Q_001512 [Saprospiraceae bacterium]|jgi:hypothetical protein
MKKPREYVSSKIISEIHEQSGVSLKGSFLIGAINPKTGKFRPRYVGVSYSGLMQEIVNSSKLKGNESFDRYRFVKTATNREAWELECKTFHEFKAVNDLTNKHHSEWPMESDEKKLTCCFKECYSNE